MRNSTLVITALLVIAAIDITVLLSLKKRDVAVPIVKPVTPNVPLPPIPQPPKRSEPDWVNHPPLRTVNDSSLGAVLADIESHMPAGHHFRESDKVTWAHETTHGINNEIRNKHGGTANRTNAFYCLNNRAAVIREPQTTIRAVAPNVPRSLRGKTYNLYLVSQASQWNDTPLYIFDEWISYTNGSAAGIDLAQKGLWTGGERSDTILFALEFNAYSLSLAMTLQNYEEAEFKNFLRWNLERVMTLYETAKTLPDFEDSSHDAYLAILRTSADAEQLRLFTRNYLGADWCQNHLGF